MGNFFDRVLLQDSKSQKNQSSNKKILSIYDTQYKDYPFPDGVKFTTEEIQRIMKTPNPRIIGFPDGQKAVVPSMSYGSLVDLYSYGGSFFLSFYQCVNYYMRCSPLNCSIDMISKNVGSIQPILVKHGDESNLILDSEILTLLKTPNCDVTWFEFISNLATYFLLTGNGYLIATGNVTKPPLEISIIRPQMVTATIGMDGYADSYRINTLGYADTERYTTMQFKKHEVNGRLRYYSDSGDQELYHIRNINPVATSVLVYGMSRLRPLFYEIEQYIASSEHNLSLLKKGAFPSGFFYFDSPFQLTEEQRTRLEMDARARFSGEGNAGYTGLLEDGMKYQPVTISNRDMDFQNNLNFVEKAIYKSLNIPLPLVTTEASTYNNMETSHLQLYDNAVLPLTNRLFQELSYFLLPRYNISDYKIWYDKGKIPQLEPRRNNQLKLMKEIGIFTVNELRQKAGYIDIENELSDVPLILLDKNKQSFSDDDEDESMTVNNDISQTNPKDTEYLEEARDVSEETRSERTNTDSGSEDESLSEEESEKKHFKTKLQKQLNKDGSKRYTDYDIKEIMVDIYGKE